MPKPTQSPLEVAVFHDKFVPLFEEWEKKHDDNGTHDKFRRLFKKNLNDAKDKGISKVTLWKWLTGDCKPVRYYKKLCSVLGVEEDYFDVKHASRETLWKHSSAFITKRGKENVSFAKDHGLNLDFVKAISELVDFNKRFPIYKPISHMTDGTYDRDVDFLSSASIDDDLEFIQIERDGKVITFHKCDLAYLIEVQDNVSRYVKFLFNERTQEMEEETKAFNLDLIEVKVNGERVSIPEDYLKEHEGEDIRSLVNSSPEGLTKALSSKYSGEISIAFKSPDEEFMLEHDRFAKYYKRVYEEPTTDVKALREKARHVFEQLAKAQGVDIKFEKADSVKSDDGEEHDER